MSRGLGGHSRDAKVYGEQTTLPGGSGASRKGDSPAVADSEVATLAAGEHRRETDDTPRRIDRYVVLRLLGVGGMGSVFEAFDPELDRRVAIKVIHARARVDATGRGRILREARAMAAVSHPHVIAVYDVGSRGNDVFIAMEFVEGQTVRAWQEARKRSWREVLELYLQAACGLAAAHAAGLVHRDFKPDNVMIGDDGVVRVLDFGIARVAACSESTSASLGPSSTHLASAPTDAMAGTPAYMAPEQFRGRPIDARADLFAFCVALYEALFGRRPFEAESLPELMARVLDGAMEPIPRGTEVPRWVAREVVRGLSVDPEARHPDMRTLIERLRRDPVRRAVRVAALPIGLAMVGGVTHVLVARDAAAPCGDPAVEMVGAWDDEARRRVEDRFAALDVSYARDAWARVHPRLDAYAQSWIERRAETCKNGRASEAAPARVLDARIACLDRRLEALRATSDVLANLDRSSVRWAARIVDALPSLDPCADEQALLSAVPPPQSEEVARRVEDLRGELERVRALDAAGRYAEAGRLAKSVLDAAADLGYAPLLAEARLLLGQVATGAGKLGQAERDYTDAYFVSLGCGHDEVAVDAAVALVGVVAEERAASNEVESWARHARALLNRTGQAAEARARLENGLGIWAHQRGLAEEAIDHHERALALRGEVFGDEHASIAASLNNLANVHATQGRELEAAQLYRRALEIEQRELGGDHPEVASTHSNLAQVLVVAGALDEADEHLERALEIQREALGHDHPEVARALANLGNVRFAREQLDAAAEAYQEALTIFRHHHRVEHPEIAGALINIAGVHLERGEYDEAERMLLEGVDMLVRTIGEEHPEVGRTWHKLAIVARVQGLGTEEARRYERALTLLRRALGPTHPEVVSIERELPSAPQRDPDPKSSL